MTDKIVFKVYNNDLITSDKMRISDKTRNYINQIKRETGLPATKIVEKCMAFAIENYEVIEL